MSDDSRFETDGRRDYPRVLAALLCLLAVVVAATAVPALSPRGAASPAESLVPEPPDVAEERGDGAAGTGAGGASTFGALSPRRETSVGGSPGGTNPLQSQSAETHFVVESSAPSYWRTAAYDTYEGDGWAREAATAPSDGRIDVAGARGDRIDYQVRLNRSATALPTVWQPARVSREDVLVTDANAVRTADPLSAGTSYGATSYAPPRDPELLRSAGRDYPEEIERRYTRLPEDVDPRLDPFMIQLTRDADSPYETALAVENWLESNKEYSLTVEDHPRDDVAGRFVFDMDAGYCEYFATAMTVMLRSQDIPARYVVGYSTGDRTGENTYTVRGMNAHAWVEVYFPDVGWVRFDPTPGSERLEQERQSYERQLSGEYEVNETGSPGEQFTAGNDTEAETPEEDETESTTADRTGRERPLGDYAVALNRSAAAGAPVSATVSRNGAPVRGATVLFNGEPVGTTGADGVVDARIPYAEELNVSLTGDRQRFVGHGSPSESYSRLYTTTQARPASATFDVETNASVTVGGDRITGGEVTVTATVDGVPVRRAAVVIDGERVGGTGSDGRASVTLPPDPGEVRVAVERGPVRGEETVSLGALDVSVTTSAPLALPGTGATVTATLDGKPAPAATVTVDGRPVADTGVDGTAAVTLPARPTARITVEHGEQRVTRTVGGLFVNLGLIVVGTVLLLSGAAVAARRVGVGAPSPSSLLGRIPVLIVTALVALAAALDGALARWDRTGLVAASLRDLLAGRRSAGDLLAATVVWVRRQGGTVLDRVLGLVPSAGTDDGEDASAAIRAAWGEFLGHVSLTRPGTHTPEAIAAHAVERDGLPPEAVWTLVDAFRAVEYGGRDPDRRAPAIRSALADIERAVDDGEGDAVAGERDGALDGEVAD